MNDPINDYVDCPVCDGTGFETGKPVSECCGVIMTYYNSGLAMCTECRQYCATAYCHNCDGTGEIKDYELKEYISDEIADREVHRKIEEN